MKKIVFYDLDGTIVDTRKDIALAANHMTKTLCGREMSFEEVYRHVGKGLMYLIEGCMQTSDPKLLEKGSKVYRDHYASHMLDNTDLYPGAKELFKRYESQTQAVVTNKPDPFSTEILKALEVDQYFCDIIAGNSQYPKKPDPTSVLAILERQEIKPEDALFVGDSGIDLETGKRANVDTVLLSHGFSTREDLAEFNPDYLVPNIEELLHLLNKKEW